MVAIAYTQTLAALMRDSLKDETPRIIAVDEVWRMLRHPSLMKFLVTATKTLRTRRKKLIMIDQQMSVFLEGDARLVFENCPIRVIFNQRGGMNVFHEDQAFQHLTPHHRGIIAALQRFQFLLDIQDRGNLLGSPISPPRKNSGSSAQRKGETDVTSLEAIEQETARHFRTWPIWLEHQRRHHARVIDAAGRRVGREEEPDQHPATMMELLDETDETTEE